MEKNHDGLANTQTESNGTGDSVVKEPEKNAEPPGPTRDPSFPGGSAAWLKFLQRILQAPEDVEPGKRIEVLIRFWVDIDGSVSRPEIIKSGGTAFDKEVMRVMKKMPKWEPALQAGRPIAVALPATSNFYRAKNSKNFYLAVPVNKRLLYVVWE